MAKLKPLDQPDVARPTVHRLPQHFVAEVEAERKAHGYEAGRQLAKSFIDAGPELRHLVPLARMLDQFGKKR